MDTFNTFLELYGLAAIFGLLLVKSAGVPIPIPADAIMLAASAQVATGRFLLLQAFLIILAALVVGGVIQFMLVRGPGRGLIYRYGRYLGITPARLDAAAARIERGGLLGIGVAILTPGVRSVAVPACGIAGIPFQRFSLGLALGSGAFLALHFLIGYAGGAALSGIGQTVPVPLVVAVIVALLVAGLGVWYIIRRRQHPEETPREALAEAVGAWHEATCPVCLALGAAKRLQIPVELEHVHAHS
jgi:membrane protein DedA with SNARE-associated domain